MRRDALGQQHFPFTMWSKRPSIVIAKIYLKLAPSFPPRHWTAAKPLERARMEYEDEVAGGFLKWFPGVNLSGLSVFDVGSGYGGRAARYRERGAERVVGLEIFPRMVEESRAFAEHKGLSNLEFHVGEGEHLPFADNTFDLVTPTMCLSTCTSRIRCLTNACGC